MTDGQWPSASPPRELDGFDLLGSIDELAAAMRRLAAVRRMAAAEHSRLFAMHKADRRAVLDGWRASADVLEHVLSDVEVAVSRGQDALYAAARSLEGLSSRPRPT